MPTPGRRLTDRMIAGISGTGTRAEYADGGAGGAPTSVKRGADEDAASRGDTRDPATEFDSQ